MRCRSAATSISLSLSDPVLIYTIFPSFLDITTMNQVKPLWTVTFLMWVWSAKSFQVKQQPGSVLPLLAMFEVWVNNEYITIATVILHSVHVVVYWIDQKKILGFVRLMTTPCVCIQAILKGRKREAATKKFLQLAKDPPTPSLFSFGSFMSQISNDRWIWRFFFF